MSDGNANSRSGNNDTRYFREGEWWVCPYNDAPEVKAGRNLPDDERRSVQRLLERLEDLRWSPAELSADQVRPLIAEASGLVEQIEQRLRALALATTAVKTTVVKSPAAKPTETAEATR